MLRLVYTDSAIYQKVLESKNGLFPMPYPLVLTVKMIIQARLWIPLQDFPRGLVNIINCQHIHIKVYNVIV